MQIVGDVVYSVYSAVLLLEWFVTVPRGLSSVIHLTGVLPLLAINIHGFIS